MSAIGDPHHLGRDVLAAAETRMLNLVTIPDSCLYREGDGRCAANGVCHGNPDLCGQYIPVDAEGNVQAG